MDDVSIDAAQLYALLPAVYRTRDQDGGGPLYGLLSVVAAQAAILQNNIDQLYDDEFIETCATWVVPYIGDLVGSDTIYDIAGVGPGRRAEVANTIGYRRRKGTVLALEQVAMDVSGLPALAVEYFKRVITAESMRHVRPRHAATPDLRRGLQLERLESAFDMLNRTVDVRRIAPRVLPQADPDPTALSLHLHGGGRYNIPDVGLWLWRWKSLPVANAPAFRVDARRFMFSPLGQDMPLFNQLAPRQSFQRLTGRLDVPQPILRREFAAQPAQFYGRAPASSCGSTGCPSRCRRSAAATCRTDRTGRGAAPRPAGWRSTRSSGASSSRPTCRRRGSCGPATATGSLPRSGAAPTTGPRACRFRTRRC